MFDPAPRGASLKAEDPEDLRFTMDHGQPGFGVTWNTKYGTTYRYIHMPLWSIALLSAGGFYFFMRRRATKIPGDSCRSCGYNLTANTSGVCPECGTPVPAGTIQQSS